MQKRNRKIRSQQKQSQSERYKLPLQKFASVLSFVTLFVFLTAKAATDSADGGTYTVPVEDLKLKNAARFEVGYSDLISKSDGTYALYYLVPEDLTAGREVHVEFHGKQASDGLAITLKGEFGEGYCRKGNGKASCFLMYKEAFADSKETELFLNAKYSDQPEFAAERIQVASVFGGDPVGVLQFDLKSEPSNTSPY